MKKVTSIFAPKVVGPYSQAVIVRKTLYSSGQIGIDPEKGTLVEGIEAQAERVCKNLGEVLREGGFRFKNVIKTTIFLKNMTDYTTVNEIYAKYFSHAPARSTVQVAGLPLGALIEIEIIAKEF